MEVFILNKAKLPLLIMNMIFPFVGYSFLGWDNTEKTNLELSEKHNDSKETG